MIRRLMFAGLAMLLAAAAPAVPTGSVKLTSQPGSGLDRVARKVAAADISDGDAKALILIGSQRLGTAGVGPALFVQVQSERSCGSAGCSTSIYLPTAKGWIKVLDAVSGPVIVDRGEHAGMHDIVVGEDTHYVWNGRTYADTKPAPQVDLRPQHPVTRTRSRAHP